MSSLIRRLSHLTVALALLCAALGLGIGRLDAQPQGTKPEPYHMTDSLKKKKKETNQ